MITLEQKFHETRRGANAAYDRHDAAVVDYHATRERVDAFHLKMARRGLSFPEPLTTADRCFAMARSNGWLDESIT